MSRTDLIILICASALVTLLYIGLWGASVPAQQVRISTETGSLEPIALDEDRDLTLQGPLGASRLEIRHGRLRFVQSPCPNQTCVRSGWLSKAGDFAACLPNRISVTLFNDQTRFDAINF